MNGKIWIKVWTILILILISIVAGFNYVIDPMWMFQHSYKFNNLQNAFDEKKLKTLYLQNNHKKFNSLLIGSSRTTYYDQNEFKNMKVFNYAFSAAKPYEYTDFIDNFKKNTKMKYLIIGIDFFDCIIKKDENKSKVLMKNRELLEDIENGNSLIYFIQNYCTIDMIKYSITNLYRYGTHKTGHRSYNRNNVAFVDKRNEKEVEKLALNRSKEYYAHAFSYDDNLRMVFNKIKSNNPDTKIIIYTTPLSKPFLDSIFNDEKLKKYYFMWIKDLVNSFDTVYFTTYYNDLSLKYKIYSIDGDHFYPFVGKEITQFISAGEETNSTINISNNIMKINKNLENLKSKIKNNK